ncbi:ATP-grasp domain-containing protein [Schleiferilactobacillus perolens]|jgi:hypothetical protein|uniref:ATP-grasp domain-containing protein n=1 Tax=Schleiferilactobacillus perolens TaxID=100468 RepID=UPI002354C32C|nr:ATP-grasp domain-containing protein [Schleiferilactobacillus perolens]MCI2171703.1 ATP-grasp domain-containing protein [Schleiferilactobacillus perolens]
MNYSFLFPADPLNPRKPDLDYQHEYQIVAKTNPVYLVQLEPLITDGRILLNRPLISDSHIIYRGWMIRPTVYRHLETFVRDNNCRLVTTTEAYEATHLLPSWSNHANTLKAKWTTDLSDTSLIQTLSHFEGPVTIKDFVKSRKYEWKSAFFIPDARDTTAALKVIHTFIKRQGADLIGGVVIRQFVDLKETGTHLRENVPFFEEYRVFYWQQRPFTVIDYWGHNTEGLGEKDQSFIKVQAQNIASPFFTIDFARRTDGRLIIMEIGDGQVSGLQGLSPEQFYLQWFQEMEKYSHSS